jgi:hypothetical protein
MFLIIWSVILLTQVIFVVVVRNVWKDLDKLSTLTKDTYEKLAQSYSSSNTGRSKRDSN